MYRLAGIEDRVLQRVVSNEMAAGFLKTFGVLKAERHLSIGDFERGIIKYLLETYSGNDKLHDLSEERLIKVGNKISRMYDEILDDEFEYTFDGLGEYLLFIFIEHAGENAYDVRESGYFDLNENVEENYSDVPMFASSSLSIKDELYLRQLFEEQYRVIAGEEPEYAAEIGMEAFIDALIKAGSVFWHMGFNDDNAESFIFWNDDFLLYDEPGEADDLGESGDIPEIVEEGGEFCSESGSVRFRIVPEIK
ncbi:MAG: hypothetical protein K6E98_11860 [Lachnospiraceae bacterium]|nr:hypothetical protein [Lachnospiraceae bacterium]